MILAMASCSALPNVVAARHWRKIITFLTKSTPKIALSHAVALAAVISPSLIASMKPVMPGHFRVPRRRIFSLESVDARASGATARGGGVGATRRSGGPSEAIARTEASDEPRPGAREKKTPGAHRQ